MTEPAKPIQTGAGTPRFRACLASRIWHAETQRRREGDEFNFRTVRIRKVLFRNSFAGPQGGPEGFGAGTREP